MKNKLTRKNNSKRRSLSKTKRKHLIKRKLNNKKTIKKKKIKRKTKKIAKGGNKTVKLFDRNYSIQDVKYDGDCMYHSILRATKEKGKEPGTLRNKKGEYFTPKDLRKDLVEKVPNYTEITDMYGEILPEILNGIKAGINDPRNPNNWGTDSTIQFVNRIYDLDIQVVNKSNFQLMSAGNPVTDDTILLLWVNGAHYMWLKEEKEDNKTKEKSPNPEKNSNNVKESSKNKTYLNENIIDLLKKKRGKQEPYIIQETAMSDEEIINVINSLDYGDESLNELDELENPDRFGMKKFEGKNSPLYYAGRNFNLPVVKALIKAGADPNKMLKGINVVNDPKVYDGETALDLLVKDFKFFIRDKRTIKNFLKFDPRSGDGWNEVYSLKNLHSMKAPTTALTTISPKPFTIRREQEIIKNTSPQVIPAIEKELDRLGPIIDYLITITTDNVHKNIMTSNQMKTLLADLYHDVPKGHPTQRSNYRFGLMKKSPIAKAIEESDLGKVKSLINPEFNIYSPQSDNPDEGSPISEAHIALDKIEEGSKPDIQMYPEVKIIKLLMDTNTFLNQQKSKSDMEDEQSFIDDLIREIGFNKFNENNFNNNSELADIYEHLLLYAFQRGAKPKPYKGGEIWVIYSHDSDEGTEIDPNEYIKKLFENSKKDVSGMSLPNKYEEEKDTPKRKKDRGLRVILGGN
jgi:hypothetical protein